MVEWDIPKNSAFESDDSDFKPVGPSNEEICNNLEEEKAAADTHSHHHSIKPYLILCLLPVEEKIYGKRYGQVTFLSSDRSMIGKFHPSAKLKSIWECAGTVGGTGSESERRREKSGLLEENGKNSEMPLFDLSNVTLATNNFSDSNKLGEGGFGPVYKGDLKNGQQIAVKRLASNSGQGTEEFKNEVTLIQQLQHRNLVNLTFNLQITDKKRQALLDWRKRFNIIIGIARGVLYLHHDSRLTIIHRDLKASNVLLDEELNPRISDFGMARIFGGNQTQANTNRVMGTYLPYNFEFLAWELWKEGRSLDLVDSTIADSCSTSEVMRCVHVGLLCVQEHSMNRPTMLSVVSMLSNETAMPQPTKPAYSSKNNFLDPDSSAKWVESRSTNDLTITELAAR
ncbi:hypothetical protein ACLOJK_039409 [Asimina triloba]